MTIYLDDTERDDTALVPVPGHPWRVLRQALVVDSNPLKIRQQLRRRMLQALEVLTGMDPVRMEHSSLLGLVRVEPSHPEDLVNWRRLGMVELDIFSDIAREQDEPALPGTTFAASALKVETLSAPEGRGLSTSAGAMGCALMSARIDVVLAFGDKSGATLAVRVHALAAGGGDAPLLAMERADTLRTEVERVLMAAPADVSSTGETAGFEDFSGRIPEIREMVQMAALNGQAALAFGSLRQEIQGLRSSLSMAHRQVQEQEADLEALRHQISAMRAGLSARASQAADEPEQLQQSVDEDLDWLPQWAQDNAGRITVMPRALAGAKKSLYEYPEHVRPALEFLAGPYRQARLGEIDREAMERALRACGCQMRGSAGSQTAGEAGQAYFIRWGRRNSLRFMDMHLTRGGGHDQRYCMRIYWFWDAESKQVVVGHLPQHLPNSLS